MSKFLEKPKSIFFDEFFFLFFIGTLEGIKKFVETDGEYGKAAPDHDEL